MLGRAFRLRWSWTVDYLRDPRSGPGWAGRSPSPDRQSGGLAGAVVGGVAGALVILLAVGFSRAGAAESGQPTAGKLPSEFLTRNDLKEKDLKRVRKVTRPTEDFSKAERFETMSGGAATSRKLVNRDAFSQFSANLKFNEERDFKLGNALFTKVWVPAPSSTQASDGLGPLFNARSCQACHIKDGRGHPPEGDRVGVSMFLRLARPAQTDGERRQLQDYVALNFSDPVYGGQLQDQSVTGVSPEGKMVIDYEEVPVNFTDGTTALLRKPIYRVENLAYGPFDPKTTLSPRVAPPMIGLGLVEAIAPADIAANADPDDADGDGISGKLQLVRTGPDGEIRLGRFGWKAQNPTIRAQAAGAFSGDIGISTPYMPDPHGECTAAEADCRKMPTGVQQRLGDTEAPDPVMDLVTFYSQNLAVPARRDVDAPQILHGKELFYGSGCISCHTPKFVTSRDAGHKAQAFQLIWPYSDFLLHDMGGGLADGQQVGRANGNEWRTSPLWGIGLTKTVNDHTFFLHDGRARNLTEAILWHGGEAETARKAFRSMEKADRDALIAFLESL
ncbi:MAG: c-type cytochrome [Salaquimonas sp.]|nr:c-type cytochrome [Salaquimonas sp.]